MGKAKLFTPVEVEVKEKGERLIGLLVEGNGTGKRSGKEVLRLALIEYYGVDITQLKTRPFLTIDFKNCGGSVVYDTWEDVPKVNVPCPCGNPNHWLIKYEMS